MKKFMIASIGGILLLVPLLSLVSAINTTKNSLSWYQTLHMGPTKRLLRQEAFWDDVRQWKAEEKSLMEEAGFGVNENRKAVFEARYQSALEEDAKNEKATEIEWEKFRELTENSYRDYDRNLLGEMTMEEYRAYLLDNWRNQEDIWAVQTKDWSETARAGRRSFNRNMHPGTKRSQRYFQYKADLAE